MTAVEPRPRSLILFRKAPKGYYENPQLAGALQQVEAAFLSLCFQQYPGALSLVVSAVEKSLKNATGMIEKKHDFYDVLNKFHEHYAVVPTALDRDTVKLFRRLRNEIEHSGESPSYDLAAARAFIGPAWDCLVEVLKTGHDFDLMDALFLETRKALVITQRTRKLAAVSDVSLSGLYFMEPLVCELRHRVRPTFLPIYDDFRNPDVSGDDEFGLRNAWRKKLEKSYSELWIDCECPICGDIGAKISAAADSKADVVTINFNRFRCPECGSRIDDHTKMPFLAEGSLGEVIVSVSKHVLEEFGFQETTYKVHW